MVLGESAKFAAERGFTTTLTKEEAIKRIEEAEEAGLIHHSPTARTVYTTCSATATRTVHDHTRGKQIALPQPGRKRKVGGQYQ